MISIICGFVFLFGGALASPLANQYFDNVLHNTLQTQLHMAHLDPAALPDFYTEFYDHIPIFGKVKGRVNYTEGNLTGLSRGQRYSECFGPAYSFGYTTYNCTIGFSQLATSYSGKLKYGKVPTVTVKAHSNITTSTVFVEVGSTPGSPPSLRKFQFHQIGTMNTKFTGLGSPLNKFLKVLNETYVQHVSAQIYNSISSRYQYALNIAVSHVPLPM